MVVWQKGPATAFTRVAEPTVPLHWLSALEHYNHTLGVSTLPELLSAVDELRALSASSSVGFRLRITYMYDHTPSTHALD